LILLATGELVRIGEDRLIFSLSDSRNSGCYIFEMQDCSDVELLRRYATDADEGGFREIVSRHAGLVYAAALRRVGSHDLARDNSQVVFLDLVRKADSILKEYGTDGSLAGWLYSTVRFAAWNQSRAERRRMAREKDVMTQSEVSAESLDWEQVCPVLDAAMEDLNAADREAVLLRFFQQKDFRAVGAALGVSDDAAQKRVSRAVERLREAFARRGIATSAVSLSAVISGNGLAGAPAGFAATLASSVLSLTPVGPAAVSVTKVFAMTTLQKSFVGAAFAVAVGTGIFETRRASNFEAEVAVLKQRPTPARVEQNNWLREELEAALGKAAALQNENSQLRKSAAEVPALRGEVARMRRDFKELAESNTAKTHPFVQQALKWKANEARLRQLFDDRADQRIPELQLVNDDAWLNMAKGADFESDTGVRVVLAEMRRYARNIFVNTLSDALAGYVRKNDGRLPNDLGELKDFFKEPVSDDLLQPYRLAHTGNLKDVPRGQWVITNEVIDAEFDTRWGVGAGGFGIIPDSPERLAARKAR
jgi:RNA polymerase sigma factor (sigma-70 family)